MFKIRSISSQVRTLVKLGSLALLVALPTYTLLIPHRASETCQLMNYTIPKDSQIYVNVWAIGRDPKVWKDPLVFNPERFLSKDLGYKGKDFELLYLLVQEGGCAQDLPWPAGNFS